MPPASPGIVVVILRVESGRSDRIRTCDVLVPNQVLYQAELRSEQERQLITHRKAGATIISDYFSQAPRNGRNCKLDAAFTGGTFSPYVDARARSAHKNQLAPP